MLQYRYYNILYLPMDEFDFIALGDITTDAFIRLSDEVHTYIHDEQRELCMAFGSKIPYENVTVVPAVGNSPNASVSAARLGLKSALITDQGSDEAAKGHMASLEKNGVDTRFVRNHDGKETNYHYVLWFKDERTILIKHHEYDYTLPDIGTPKWIYMSSLGEKLFDYHEQIANYLEAHPTVKFAYQPGTFQIKIGYEKSKRLYNSASIFFCNTDEARKILDSEEQDGAKLACAMSEHGPKITVITDGPKGLHAHDSATSETWFMPPYPDPKPPLDRTGAGDSFSSTVTVALALGLSLEDALRWGPINSMSVVQYVGAQEGLLTREKLEEYLANAPADYHPTKV
ncbi:MAG: carbohydrate kinase family protein [bacterium]|nr:carbohydrate kinase family protein [bacterium]